LKAFQHHISLRQNIQLLNFLIFVGLGKLMIIVSTLGVKLMRLNLKEAMIYSEEEIVARKK
jgi:hypothetical protein